MLQKAPGDRPRGRATGRDVRLGPPTGLRARKRAAARRHIQTVALDLFDRDGFDKVTIEQIASAADVSPSSIYRYFGTKEGVIVHDEYDDWLIEAAERYLADHNLLDAVQLVFEEVGTVHLDEDSVLTRRRMPYMFEVPAVRAATFLAVDDAVDAIARQLCRPGRTPNRTLLEARVEASAVIWGLLGALTAWYERGGAESMVDAVRDGIAALRGLPRSGGETSPA